MSATLEPPLALVGVARRLVAEADVLVESFRPGTFDKWNLSYERLSEASPGLVLVRVSGFGQGGPLVELEPGFPGFEAVNGRDGEAGQVGNGLQRQLPLLPDLADPVRRVLNDS